MIDPVPIRVAEAQRIEAQYGVTVWFGYFTRAWWAYVEDADIFTGTLIEAPTPDKLGEEIMAARRPA